MHGIFTELLNVTQHSRNTEHDNSVPYWVIESWLKIDKVYVGLIQYLKLYEYLLDVALTTFEDVLFQASRALGSDIRCS